MSAGDEKDKKNKFKVAVITTSGTWPQQGFDEVPENQPVKVELEHASKNLGIRNTTGWVATVTGRELAIDRNYVENKLTSPAEIHWGPREGGGGVA